MKSIYFLLFLAVSLLFGEEHGPKFMPEGEPHPIIAAIKIIGMIATAIFVIVMVYRSIRVVKDDEDDHVHLPD